MSAAPVLIMAGGTGGHIFPGLAVAAALRARGVPVAWLGSRHGLENRLVPAAGVELATIAVAALRGKGWLRLLSAPLSLARALWQALAVLRRLRPRCAISFGGFAAGPGGIAAWLTRCPLLVHEQNAVAGVTNRVLARRARRVLTGFPDVLGGDWVGNPVRASIATLPPPVVRFAEHAGAPRLLVLGGSQGARALNHAVPQAVAALPEHAFEIRHQCGAAQVDVTRAAYAQIGRAAEVTAFIERMDEAYGWADLVVARAGALTVAELAACGIGALLVPFPHAVDDHQTVNARWLVEAGAALLLPEGERLDERLAEALRVLATDPARRLAMAEAARALARTDAADAVAAACLAEARA